MTRNISDAFARLALGKQEYEEPGNLDAKRDRGDAKEGVEVMWCLLQQEAPDTYVLATGQPHSIRDLAEMPANAVGRLLAWNEDGCDMLGIDRKTGVVLPEGMALLLRNPGKPKRKLDRVPRASVEGLCAMVAQTDLTPNA